MRSCAIIMPLMLVASLGCHDGPMFALKKVNPVYRSQWKRDQELGLTHYMRREQLERLVNKIGRYSAEEQAQSLKSLEDIMESDESPEMRHLAIRAAQPVPGDQALKLLEQGLEDESLKVRLASCDALSNRTEKEAANLLIATIGTAEDSDVQHAAIHALRGHQGPMVKETLKNSLASSDPAIRATVIDSLKVVTGEDLGTQPGQWIAYLEGKPVDKKSPVRWVQRLRERF